MKYQLLKQKAVFQIFLIISLSFYSALAFGNLNKDYNEAENKSSSFKFNYFDFIQQDLLPSVEAQTKVCCEKTTALSPYNGTSCVFTEEENCQPGLKKDAVACDQTIYCAPGVCILNNVCQDNVEKGLCEQRNGIYRSGKSSEISQCQIGCCDLPTGASLTTEAQCANAIKDFPLRLNEVFDETIKDEAECVRKRRGTEEG